MKVIVFIASLMLLIIASGRAEASLEDSIYKVDVEFGEQVFLDILVVGKQNQQTRHESKSSTTFDSSFTVPGVFTKNVKLELVTIDDQKAARLSFILKTKEGDNSIDFQFDGRFDQRTETFEGKITDRETQTKIGTFSGERIHDVNR